MAWFRKKDERTGAPEATTEPAVEQEPGDDTVEVPDEGPAPLPTDEPTDETAAEPSAGGPWDASEAPESARVDLGSLLVPVRSGYAIQVPPEEGTEERMAVLLVTEQSVLELRAFAASRSGSLWDEVRADLALEVERLEGRHVEAPGPFGTELRTGIPAELPDGQEGVQPGRILGVDGPRWFLRGTLLGLAAFDDEAAAPLLDAMRDVVVVRGDDAMPSREPLRLRIDPSIPLLDEDGQPVDPDPEST